MVRTGISGSQTVAAMAQAFDQQRGSSQHAELSFEDRAAEIDRVARDALEKAR